MKIGIIGVGVVGKSVYNMLEGHDVHLNDPAKGFNDHCYDSRACFICVPTPTVEGVQDLDILTSVLDDFVAEESECLIIIKSTVLPLNMKKILDTYKLNIMVSPEFLNQYEPYYAMEKHLIGVECISQAHLYRKIFGIHGYGHKDVRTTNPITACMVKYVHNCHGALKVAFFNEVFDACAKEQINYREMLGSLFAMNDNVGEKYTRTSPDGQRGFGGACFPKDVTAFSNSYEFRTLQGAITSNLKYRKEEMESCM